MTFNMESDIFDQEPKGVEAAKSARELLEQVPYETGGREGLDPSRYGDWEKNGRCIDF